MGELETVATERLEAEILAGAARSTAAMYRWLCHVAEFDRRDVARSWGFVSTAAWLAWRCGLGSRTARDQVSVARRLQYLPNIAAAMASGSLSYTKVRALCRVATPANERDVLDLAVAFTAAQLEEVLRRYKAVDDTGSPVPDPEPADPSSIGFAWNDYGRLDVRADLSALDGATVIAWLRAEAEAIMREELEGGTAEPSLHCGCSGAPGEGGSSHEPCNDGSAEPTAARRDRVSPRSQRFAQALVRAAGRRLDALLGRSGEKRDRHVILVHAELETLCGLSGSPGYLDGGPAITAEELDALLERQTPMQLLVKDSQGNPLFLGRTTKEPNRYFRRAMRVRDHGRCQFPGCANELRLNGHHVLWWVRDEGPTDIWNVVSLCPRHHGLVHRGEFRVEADGKGGFTFIRSRDGVVLENSPQLPEVADLMEMPAAVSQPNSGCGERMNAEAMEGALLTLSRTG